MLVSRTKPFAATLLFQRGSSWSRISAAWTAAAINSTSTASQTSQSTRRYPEHPRVGVGVVLFKARPAAHEDPEVLVVKRAKEPSKGMWSFPGGGLELGETLADCAAREIKEETGLIVRNRFSDDAEGLSSSLCFPTTFAASDAIHMDASGRIQYHYAIIEVAAVLEDPDACHAVASDDVSEARWVRVSALRELGESLTPLCARFAEEAVRRFSTG